MTLRVVISGVNLVEGGALEVLRDCISAFLKVRDISLICLVNDRSLFQDFSSPQLRVIEFPQVKQSWFRRIIFEYFTSSSLSRELDVDVWLSMHDISPRVFARKQYVYCHNPSPFYRAGFRDFLLDKKFFLFTFFYHFLYRLNIKSNAAVIVQQGWMVSFFKDLLGAERVWVARPTQHPLLSKNIEVPQCIEARCVKFFYPAFARSFKNFEVIFRALRIISKDFPSYLERIKVQVTISGDENRYSCWLKTEFGSIAAIDWAGRMSREEVEQCYKSADVVIFPSRLETWGLPITEAKNAGKPLLVADLPYAHETVGDYSSVCFFEANDADLLAQLMIKVVDGEHLFTPASHVMVEADAVLNSWSDLVNKITEEGMCR
ncbi:glycosyltransferase [Metapseudomonas otitidis]|uniref:glycosyltransferase n=1 Tax=Metapseudomonas otitidis TaxID=319939 RepID=UPI0013F5B0C2|nr:glycosyltransferase [Pseudomonas otitidis]